MGAAGFRGQRPHPSPSPPPPSEHKEAIDVDGQQDDGPRSHDKSPSGSEAVLKMMQ